MSSRGKEKSSEFIQGIIFLLKFYFIKKMHKFEEEFKKILKINNKLLRQYYAYKFYKEPNKNSFIVQVRTLYSENI
jgi:hypothetical protein